MLNKELVIEKTIGGGRQIDWKNGITISRLSGFIICRLCVLGFVILEFPSESIWR